VIENKVGVKGDSKSSPPPARISFSSKVGLHGESAGHGVVCRRCAPHGAVERPVGATMGGSSVIVPREWEARRRAEPTSDASARGDGGRRVVASVSATTIATVPGPVSVMLASGALTLPRGRSARRA